jgi:hypothetical protein
MTVQFLTYGNVLHLSANAQPFPQQQHNEEANGIGNPPVTAQQADSAILRSPMMKFRGGSGRLLCP